MNIIINDHRKIFAIQEEFNSTFPNLIIEFYAKAHKSGGVPSTHLVKHDKTLGEVRTIHKKGNVTISPSMTSAEVKENFRDVYGLAAEIFKHTEKGRAITDERKTLEEENKISILNT